ncbi:putative ribonuclease H-like domain-containing protein [Tanacetum coccineum]
MHFLPPLTPDDLIKFVNDLGYSKVVRTLSNVVTSNMLQSPKAPPPPKHTKPLAPKAATKKPKPAPAKPQEKKQKTVTETSKAPSPAKRSKAEVQGKGKEKVSDEQVALDLLNLQTLKKKSPADQYIFQRRTSTQTEPTGHDESSLLYAGPNPGDAEASQPPSSHIVNAGPNLEHMDLEASDTSIQPNPEQMDEEFTTTAYPNVQENLKLPTEGEVRLEEPASSAGTMSSLKHLDKELNFVDQFLVEKSQEDEPEKTNTESEVQSMVTVPTAVQAPLPTLTATTTATTLPLPPQPQQGSSDLILIQRISELEQHMVDLAIQAPLKDRFRDLPEADMKEILHHRMWESNSYQAHEDHKQLYKALEKKKKKRHASSKTPPGSPPYQPPPPPPPASSSGTPGASGASGLRLNHLNFDTINDLARKDLVRGLPRLKFEKDHLCSACQLGKSKKHTHKPKTENTNLEVLSTLHTDVCGPMRVQTINGKKYILVIVNDYSRFTWVKFLRSKDETPEIIMNVSAFFIKRQFQGLHSRTAARTMLIFSKAPTFLWAEKPDLTFFKVFGALSYPTNDSEDLGKLQPTTDIGIFVGYAPSRKGYRIYNKRTRRIMETIHMQFDELTEQMAPVQLSTGPAPSFLTPGHISSGLVPNPVPAAPYVPPTNKDLDILFQPMFDEYLEPPRIERPVSPAPAVQVPVNSTGTPSSTTIDQDALSPSHSPSSSALQSPNLYQGIAAKSTLMEDNPFAPTDNDPFINVFALEPRSEASSSGDLSSTESPYDSQTLHHLGKWSKDHPLDNIIGNPS